MASSSIADDFLRAVVKEAHARGMRAETLLAVWYAESGLNPQSSPDGAHFGLNMIMGSILRQQGIDPQEYVSRPAIGQLPVVLRDLDQRIKMTGGQPFASPAAYEAANLCPARVKPGAKMEDVFARDPDVCYTGNAGVDRQKKGFITYGDIGAWVENRTKEAPYQAIRARAAAIEGSAPGPGGSGGGSGGSKIGLAIGALALVALFLRKR